MAQTVYRSLQAVTLQNRSRAYEYLASMCLHLESLNLNLIALSLDGSNFVQVTLSNPLPPEQIAHLGLQ